MGAFSSPLATILVESQPNAVPFAEAEPADARGQSLKGDALFGHVEPVMQVLVMRQ
jgi:hypothetical protein